MIHHFVHLLRRSSVALLLLAVAHSGLMGEVMYSPNICGWYQVTVPAKEKKVIGSQLLGASTQVTDLFGVLDRRSSVVVFMNDTFIATTRHSITGRWSIDYLAMNPGEAAEVYNGGEADVTLTFVGDVVPSKTFSFLAEQARFACSVIPIALTTPEKMGYTRNKQDLVTKYENASYIGYEVHRITGLWSSGPPSFEIGEGMMYTLKAASAWTQEASSSIDSLVVTCNPLSE